MKGQADHLDQVIMFFAAAGLRRVFPFAGAIVNGLRDQFFPIGGELKERA